MFRSKYTYTIDGNYLFIVDIGDGEKSVTNDIEEVLIDLTIELKTSMDNFIILYKDTEGRVDRVETKNGEFISFKLIGEKDFYAAKLKIK